jgi:hypothetical protein
MSDMPMTPSFAYQIYVKAKTNDESIALLRSEHLHAEIVD